MVPELLEKYIWLINTFLRAREHGISLQELQEMWERRYDAAYSRSSFNHHREAVSQIFGIEIECDRRSNRYFIRYSDDVKDSDAASSWLINTFTVNNLLTITNYSGIDPETPGAVYPIPRTYTMGVSVGF